MDDSQTKKTERFHPRNVNEIHKEKMSLMDRIGLKITLAVGTMTCAVIFAIIALISLPSVLNQTFSGGHFQPILIVAWVAQTFLQLVLLSIIMVGQNVQSDHAEIRSDEEYKTTIASFNYVETILDQLKSQQAELKRQGALLEKLTTR